MSITVKFYLIGIMLVFFALFLGYIGNVMRKTRVASDAVARVPGGRLGARMRVIRSLFGENAGAMWIRMMGYLCLLTAVAMVGAAFYIVIAQPAHLVKF